MKRKKRRWMKDASLWGFALIAALALLLGAWGIQRLSRLSYFQVTQVSVEGHFQLPAEEVVAGLGLPPHANLLELDLEALHRRLLRNPWIKEAFVRRRLPFTLIVRVVERMPEAILMADKAYLLSSDGVVLSEVEGDVPPLPLLRAPVQRPYTPGEVVLPQEVAKGLSIWQRLQTAAVLSGKQTREIAIAQDGSYTVSMGPQLPLIRLRAEDVDEQLKRLGHVLTLTGDDLGSYEYVDLRFGGKVIVRPREG